MAAFPCELATLGLEPCHRVQGSPHRALADSGH